MIADWPRAIHPENRVKYLIEARHDFKDSAVWNREKEGDLMCFTDQDECLHVQNTPTGFMAWYSTLGEGRETLVGEFDTALDGKKALIDHVVVVWAVRQAWADLAT